MLLLLLLLLRGGGLAVGSPQHELDKRDKGHVLRKVVNKLVYLGVADRDACVYILHARVPIIKFIDRRTGAPRLRAHTEGERAG